MATSRIPTTLKNAVSTALDTAYPDWRLVGMNSWGIERFNQELTTIINNNTQWQTLTAGLSVEQISQLREDLIDALDSNLKAAKGMGEENRFHDDNVTAEPPSYEALRGKPMFQSEKPKEKEPKTFLPTAPKVTAHADPMNVKDQHFTKDANYIWMGKDKGGWAPISSLSYEETNKAVVDINRKIKVYNKDDINCQRRDILEEQQRKFGNSKGCNII